MTIRMLSFLFLLFATIYPTRVFAETFKEFSERMDAMYAELSEYKKSEKREEYIEQRKKIEEICNQFILDNPSLDDAKKIDIYEKLLSHYSCWAMQNTSEREKLGDYSKNIIELANGRLSEAIIGAHVDHAYVTSDTNEFVELYSYLSHVERLSDEEIKELLIEQDKRDDQQYIRYRIRGMASGQKDILAVRLSRQIKRIDDPEQLAEVKQIISQHASTKDARRSKVAEKPDRPEPTPEEKLRSFAKSLGYSISAHSPSYWLDLLDNKEILQGNIRKCDLVFEFLVRNLKLYLVPVRKPGYSLAFWKKATEKEKDQLIEYVKTRVFGDAADDWSPVYRHLTEDVLLRENMTEDNWERNTNLIYIETMFGTDFAYSVDRDAALRKINDHWKKVKDNNFREWKVSELEMANYKNLKAQHFSLIYAQLEIDGKKRLNAIKKFPEVKEVFEGFEAIPPETASDIDRLYEFIQSQLRLLDEAREKYKNDPDWKYVQEQIDMIRHMYSREEAGQSGN